MKGEKNKVKGERNMLQGENDRVQGENTRFWKGGKRRFQRVGKKGFLRVEKTGFEGGKERDDEKTILRGLKTREPETNELPRPCFRLKQLPWPQQLLLCFSSHPSF